MQRLWRSSKNPKETPNKQLTQVTEDSLLLPNQIGCRIIEIEMEVAEADNLTKEIILELLHQYSRAVEFYEERGSKKYLQYQKKMQHFLSKPAISQILKGKTGTLLIKKQKNEQQLKKLHNQSQITAKKLLEDSQQSGQKQNDIIRRQLQSQQKNLEERIQRKRAISNRSTKGENQKKEDLIGTLTGQVFSKTGQGCKKKQIEVSEFMENPHFNTPGNAKKNFKVFI